MAITNNALDTATSGLAIPLTSNQIILGNTNTLTINAPSPSASRILTIPDPGANASFVLTESAQTINGAKTLTGNTSFKTDLSATSLVSIGGGATNSGTSGVNQIEFQYAGPTPGGYRHFISSWHEGAASSNNNRLRFHLNNSTSASGSSSPGTGNVLGLEISATALNVPLALNVTGATTFNSTIAGSGSNIDVATGNDIRISTTGKLNLAGTDENYYIKYESPGGVGSSVRVQGFNNVLLSTGLTGANEGGITISSSWGPRVYIGGATGGYNTSAKDRLEVAGGINFSASPIGNATGSPGVMQNGTIGWNGTNFIGRKNGAWVNLDDPSTPFITNYTVDVATSNTVTLVYNNGSAGVGATLSGVGAGSLIIDATLITLGMKLLMKDMGNPEFNGVYVCTTEGNISTVPVLTRVSGFDSAANWATNQNAVIYVSGGGNLFGTYWKLTPPPPTTIGTDSITFTPTNLASLNAIQPNISIGGNFDTNPWQRGTTFTGITGGVNTYTADRFFVAAQGSTITVTKQADAPSISQAELQVSNSLRMTVTSSSAQAAGDYCYVSYAMEGYDWTQIAQSYFTASFWVKATVTGTYSISFFNGSFDNGFSTTFTINASNTWEYKKILVSPSTTSGTWNNTNQVGIYIRIYMNCGITNQTSTLNSWQSVGYRAANTQTNGSATNGNIFALALFKVEKGYGATKYPHELEADVFKRASRYYRKSYTAGTYAGANTLNGSIEFCVGGPATDIPNGTVLGTVHFDKMRAAPTVTVYSPTNGAAANVQDISKLPTVEDYAVSVTNIGDSGFKVANNTGSTLTSGDNYAWHYVANAEL